MTGYYTFMCIYVVVLIIAMFTLFKLLFITKPNVKAHNDEGKRTIKVTEQELNTIRTALSRQVPEFHNYTGDELAEKKLQFECKELFLNTYGSSQFK